MIEIPTAALVYMVVVQALSALFILGVGINAITGRNG